ncbi:MAG: SpoIIE family protein phosphatase [Planctomycetota bacterium]
MPELQVQTGPAAGRTLELSDGDTLGRDIGADLRLNDQAMSRRHAQFNRSSDGHYVVKDLDSHNGTFVNRRKIRKRQLRNGDEIQAGKTRFLYKDSSTTSAVALAEETRLDVHDEESTQVINSIAVDGLDASKSGSNEETKTQLEMTHRRLMILMRLLQSVNIGMDENLLLSQILDALFRAFPGTDRGSIILRDPENGELRLAAVKDRAKDPENRDVSISRTLLKHVLKKKKAVLSTDVRKDQRFKASETVKDLNLRSVMYAPLKHDGEVLGFVCLDTRRVNAGYDREALGVLAALANFITQSIVNVRMHEELVSQEKLKQDLRNAQRIQHSFLPQGTPDIAGYEFADWYTAAHKVGGDFYDFIRLPDGRWGITIGDVSGKGITAALLMAKLATDVRSAALSGASPAGLVREINQDLVSSGTERYVTLVYMVLDCDNCELEYVNAGHWPPILRRPEGTVEQLNQASGLPAGVRVPEKYHSHTLQVEPQDRICLYTDGVIDAMNNDHVPFGINRLTETIQSASPQTQAILEEVQHNLWDHMDGAEQHDDTTLVCFGPC